MDFSVFDAARALAPNLHWSDAIAFVAQQGPAQFAVAQQIVAAFQGGSLTAIATVLANTVPGEIQFGLQFMQILENGAPAA